MINKKRDSETDVIRTMAWMRIMPHVEGMYASQIAKKLDITYSHVVKIIRALEKKGWISREKHGRIVRYKFTSSGHKMKNCCDDILIATGEYSLVK